MNLNWQNLIYREIEEKEAGMMNFSREVETSRKLYETFLQRVKETNEAQEFTTI